MGYVTSYQRAQYCLRWFVTPLTHFQSCGYFVGRRHSQSSTHFPSCMSLSCYYTIDEIGRQSWLWRQEYPLLPPKMIFDSEMWHPNSVSYPLSSRSFLFGPAILSALGLSLTDYANFGCPFSVYNKGDKKGEVCVSILVSRGILPVLITFATHLPPSIFADVPCPLNLRLITAPARWRWMGIWRCRRKMVARSHGWVCRTSFSTICGRLSRSLANLFSPFHLPRICGPS